MHNFIQHFESDHLPQLQALYQQTWWGKNRSETHLAKMLDNTPLTLGITDAENQLIGFARVLTDYTYKALILDVMVDSQHQGKGLGQLLIDQVLEHPSLANVLHVELYCKESMLPFYERWGFVHLDDDLYFMRKDNPSSI